MACTPLPLPDHEAISAAPDLQKDVWAQVFAVPEVSQVVEMASSELAQASVLALVEAGSPQSRLESIRVLYTLSPWIAKSMLITL